VIPVDREPLGPPTVYGQDRLFAYLRLAGDPDVAQDEAVAALETSGQPVVRINLEDVYDIGAEVFRWELATAIAGSILEINPFDQPDVEASKVETRELTEQYEQIGELPAEEPIATAGGLALYADDKTPPSYGRRAMTSATSLLRTWLGSAPVTTPRFSPISR
jgi:Glucose-6-phosphate isomerase